MIQPFKLYKIVILAVVIIYIAACAGIGQRLEPPQVKLANIRLESFNILETVFDVQLRVFNTNDTTIYIRGVESEIEINGKAFALGVSKSDVEVPAFGTALLPLRVYSSVVDIIKSAADLHTQEQLRYHIKGKLRLGAGTFPGVLPFDSEGNISLPDLSGLKARSPSSD